MLKIGLRVRAGYLSNISIKIDKKVVPKIPFITKFFPFLIKDKMKSGMFRAIMVIPMGSFKK